MVWKTENMPPKTEKLSRGQKKLLEKWYNQHNPKITPLQLVRIYKNFLKEVKEMGPRVDWQDFDFEQEIMAWDLTEEEVSSFIDRKVGDLVWIKTPSKEFSQIEELKEEKEELEEWREKAKEYKKKLEERGGEGSEELVEEVQKLIDKAGKREKQFEKMMDKVVTKEEFEKVIDRMDKAMDKLKSKSKEISKRGPRTLVGPGGAVALEEPEKIHFAFGPDKKSLRILADGREIKRLSLKKRRSTIHGERVNELHFNMGEIKNVKFRKNVLKQLEEKFQEKGWMPYLEEEYVNYLAGKKEWEEIPENVAIFQNV